nr:glycosyltransferase family 2 protein [Quisquiliibacterium transsilvanicum]
MIPCHNEAVSIAATVERFRRTLPSATIYVYDNRSTDGTADIARRAGAVVRFEPLPGKGSVVRRMFGDIDADVYVMADGDNTYEAEAAPAMIQRLLDERLDMVIGIRRGVHGNAHRKGHASGNRAFNGLYRRLFGAGFTDIFSGYRVFSHRFAKSFPAISSGFEIETEMSVYASQLRMPVAEMDTHYAPREEGSHSKLNTMRDGTRILSAMMLLFKEVRPMLFFGGIGVSLALLSLVLAWPLFLTWQETGLVPRLPTAVLATGLMSLAAMSAGCGLILDSVARGRLEQKRFNYLSLRRRSPEPDGTPHRDSL